MLLVHRLLGLSESVVSLQALLDGASSLVLGDHGHEDVHQNVSQVLRGCWEADMAHLGPKTADTVIQT